MQGIVNVKQSVVFYVLNGTFLICDNETHTTSGDKFYILQTLNPIVPLYHSLLRI